MKKLLSLVLICGITAGASAQDKKFQIGLTFGPTLNWTKIQTTKLEKNGLGSGFTIGVGGNYMFNENVGLASGIQFDLETSKLNYGNPNTSSLNPNGVFYAYTDTDIQKFKDGAVSDFSDTTAFMLMTRQFKAKYVTIPIFLKFQTSLIGKFKYYGKFGLRTSILAGVRLFDDGKDAAYDPNTQLFSEITTSTLRTRDNMKPVGLKKGLSPVRLGIGMYLGTEWNFTGSTSLAVEIGYYYGFTPLHLDRKTEKTTLYTAAVENGTSTDNNFSNQATQTQLMLKVSLLF